MVLNKCILNKHFKTLLYLRHKSRKAIHTKISTDKYEYQICSTKFSMYYSQNIVFKKVNH